MSLESSLYVLAEKLGVTTDFWDWKGRHTRVPQHTIIAVMAAMGVDAATETSTEAAIAELELKPWRRGLPPVVVVSEGDTTHVEAHVVHGHPAQIRLRLEDGEVRYLGQRHHMVEPREVDGTLIGEASFAVPSDLPTGYPNCCPMTGSPTRPSSLPRASWGCPSG